MMNKRLRLAVRNADCTDCKMSREADGLDVCVTGQGPHPQADVMVVTKFPVQDGRLKAELVAYLDEAGLDTDDIMWCSAVKCRVWDLDPSKTDLKACRKYLDQEIAFVKPKFILSLGSEALFATTGHAGITKYRGKTYGNSGAIVYPTISPSMVARNPGLRQGFIADLQYFTRLTQGNTDTREHHLPDDEWTVDVLTKADLKLMLEDIRDAGIVAFDIENTISQPTDPDAAIVSVCVTTASDTCGMGDAMVWRLPLFHPESPWRKQWQQVVAKVGTALAKVPKRVAHNGKHDCKWMRHFGATGLVPTFDTIMAASCLDENRPKGLKPLGMQILGADPWGIDTKDLLTTPLDDVLVYNGLDTWHDLRLYYHFRDQLVKQPRLGRLFKNLLMPVVQELIPIEARGVYVDQDKLMTNWNVAKAKLEDIEAKLYTYVPPTSQIPQKLISKKGKVNVNFNPSNFARWWLFDYLQFPVLARGKTKDNGNPGDPSMAEATMLDLAELENGRLSNQDVPMSGGLDDNIPKLLLDRTTWFRMGVAFFRPYSEQLDSNSRIHTVFKPWGTVTGRMSSGKEDTEKVTGKAQVNGVNLQQVPRDSLVRGVFGAPPGSSFVEADYSQVELRIAAWMAREDTMLHLYRTGQDIHMAMAMRMTGKPQHAVTADERKKAKAVNFGFLYGMGWFKFVSTAWLNYGVRVTEEEAKAFRRAFFDQFPKLIPWHAKQRRLANQFGRVETPMGRIRHLPDIFSPDEGVRAEAERQAINSPVQAFASDMAALAMVHIARDFRSRGLRAHPVGTVHDAINFEIPNNELTTALPIIKDKMENLPLDTMFGIRMDVPIIGDLKVGQHWGGATPIPADVVIDDAALAAWLDERVAA